MNKSKKHIIHDKYKSLFDSRIIKIVPTKDFIVDCLKFERNLREHLKHNYYIDTDCVNKLNK